jgi:biotin synthase-like enzyme
MYVTYEPHSKKTIIFERVLTDQSLCCKLLCAYCAVGDTFSNKM